MDWKIEQEIQQYLKSQNRIERAISRILSAEGRLDPNKSERIESFSLWNESRQAAVIVSGSHWGSYEQEYDIGFDEITQELDKMNMEEIEAEVLDVNG